MPRAFSDEEDAEIVRQLKDVASRYFAAQGVRRTSIDQLTQAVGIAKGSFYKYYKSKELLFFELLTEAQNRIRAPMTADLPEGKRSVNQLTRRGIRMFEEIRQEPLIQLTGNIAEFASVSRKVPSEVLEEHQKEDRLFLAHLVSYWNRESSAVDMERVAAAVTLFVSTALRTQCFGDRLLKHARDITIDGLISAIWPR